MRRRSDRDRVLDIIVELANSAHPGAGDDPLATPQDLQSLADRWIVTESLPPTDHDLGELHRFRERCRAVFLAPTERAQVEVANDLLSRSQIHPRLVEHDELGLHMHYFRPYCSVAEHLQADCAMTIALFLAEGNAARLKVCAADGCGTAFIDRSNNRSRMYCDSQGCGNRLHAAAYRSRQASRNGVRSSQ